MPVREKISDKVVKLLDGDEINAAGPIKQYNSNQ